VFRWLIIAGVVLTLALYLAPKLQKFAVNPYAGDYGAETGSKRAEEKPGEMFIRKMIDQGALRRATTQDEIDWVRGLEHPENYHGYQALLVLPKNLRTDLAFVVLDKIEFPSGALTDGVLEPKTFIVPAGIPVPRGALGDSALWITEPHECRGGFFCFGMK
jgi:hypothetical protein